MYPYQIFDTAFHCEFSLPELVETDERAGSLLVKQSELRSLDKSGFEITYEWFDEHDQRICWCERRGDEYLFTFTLHASFHVSPGGLITCMTLDGGNPIMMRHLLLNQIIPRYMASCGSLLLHAAAVTVDDGRSLAFMGRSGSGKSTLVSSFHRTGAKLISDDCILLRSEDEVLTAIGGLAGVRLLPDSLEAIFHESTGFTRYSPYTEKQQLLLRNDTESSVAPACQLNALFILDAHEDGDQADSIIIEEIPPSAALMAMNYCAFSMDPSDWTSVTRNFDQISTAINKGLGIFSLKYPRKHDLLPEVMEAIRTHI